MQLSLQACCAAEHTPEVGCRVWVSQGESHCIRGCAECPCVVVVCATIAQAFVDLHSTRNIQEAHLGVVLENWDAEAPVAVAGTPAVKK